MIDVSGIEYDFLPSVLWVAGLTAVGLGLLFWSFRRIGAAGEMALFVTGALLTGGSLFLGVTVGIGAQSAVYVTSQEIKIASEQLSDQGFSRVDLDWEGKTFTASVDGEYFEGLLHPVGDYKYQVLEVGAVQP